MSGLGTMRNDTVYYTTSVHGSSVASVCYERLGRKCSAHAVLYVTPEEGGDRDGRNMVQAVSHRSVTLYVWLQFHVNPCGIRDR